MPTSPALQDKTMPFLEHLAELRRRLIFSLLAALAGSVVCYIFYQSIIDFLLQPFQALEELRPGRTTLYVSTVFEGFLMRFKVAFLSGILLTLPVHVYQVVRFVFPGLKPREKAVFTGLLLCSALLCPGGFFYGYTYIIPFSLDFLTGAGFIPDQVGFMLNYEKNIGYIIQFLLAFIIVFQAPLVLILLLMLGLVSRKQLFQASRFIIVGIFILSALITPPDFVSQLCVALPLLVLFLCTLGIASVFRLGEKGAEDA